MKPKNDILRQAIVIQGHKMVAKALVRTVLSLILLCCGGTLLYLGLSDQKHLFTTFGIIFILYALFMRFHVRRTKTIIAELEQQVQNLTATEKAKEDGNVQPEQIDS